MRKVGLLLSLILLTGCATRSAAPQPRPKLPVVAAPAPPVLSPADYIAISASRSLLLVRGAELVAARDPALAGDAMRVAAAHRGIAAQLNMAGRRLDLLPSAELLPSDRLQLEGLGRDSDVATAWQRTLTANMADCDRHEGDYALRGTSPTLRPIARFALGVCREELARRR